MTKVKGECPWVWTVGVLLIIFNTIVLTIINGIFQWYALYQTLLHRFYLILH